MAISGHIGWMRFTSALPPKADIREGAAKRLLVMAVLENFRPPGEIVLPTPNVVEVVGGDKDIAKANKNLQEIYKQLGDLMAAKALRDLEIKK